jgi:hypothetical protein
MDINSQNDIEMENKPGSPLPPPQFDAAMVSEAQQVEPLPARRARRTGPARNVFGGRLGVLVVILITLFLGAAAFGMFLGLRDRQSSIEDPATANQATPEATNARETVQTEKAVPVKAPVKESTRTQRAEVIEPEPKPVAPLVRARRSVRVSLSDLDQEKSGQPAARKVGEIFSGVRHDDRHGHRGERRRRERDDDNE